jgi:hypothetical protein
LIGQDSNILLKELGGATDNKIEIKVLEKNSNWKPFRVQDVTYQCNQVFKRITIRG